MLSSTSATPSGWYGIIIGLAALGWNVYNAIAERRPNLIVRQIGDSATDAAHTQPDGRVIYMLRVVISNESTRKPAVLAHFQLRLPWKDEYLDLLPDPDEVGKSEYVIPGSTNMLWRYSRDMILNHRVDDEGKLDPGDVIEGALLFNGMEPIPVDVPHGSTMEAELRIFLQSGRFFSSSVQMRVDRGREGEFVQPSGEDLAG